ncbi:MAG: hypothetical protein KKF44_11260 [Nanoarchaeota archaeon]|nr:hypothetical protein [Nanoarchaeota archaeon]
MSLWLIITGCSPSLIVDESFISCEKGTECLSGIPEVSIECPVCSTYKEDYDSFNFLLESLTNSNQRVSTDYLEGGIQFCASKTQDTCSDFCIWTDEDCIIDIKSEKILCIESMHPLYETDDKCDTESNCYYCMYSFFVDSKLLGCNEDFYCSDKEDLSDICTFCNIYKKDYDSIIQMQEHNLPLILNQDITSIIDSCNKKEQSNCGMQDLCIWVGDTCTIDILRDDFLCSTTYIPQSEADTDCYKRRGEEGKCFSCHFRFHYAPLPLPPPSSLHAQVPSNVVPA